MPTACKRMHPFNQFAFLVALLGVAAPSCRSAPDEAPADARAMEAPLADQAPESQSPEPTQQSREAARTIAMLHELITVDRKAVELSEQQLLNVRDLYRAGRVTTAEVQAAELHSRQCQLQLQHRERQLADAEAAAVEGSPASAAGSGTPDGASR